jgi:hypothetical protein
MRADPGLAAFRYDDCSFPIRDDIPVAHRRAWARLAAAGAWWTGEQRIAIAAEVRSADGCRYCAERREALSPAAIIGVHDSAPTAACLPEAAVDATHRISTDAGRLTRSFVDAIAESGVGDGGYVEMVGVVATTLSIDRFHQAMGLPLEPLPAPVAGEPSRYRPPGAKPSAAFVPIVSGRDAKGAEADLYDGLPVAANVLSALSLVPDEVRQLDELSAAHYLPRRDMMHFDRSPRAISRAQIELLAGRVSALNECFY